jgi:hypothetical protein
MPTPITFDFIEQFRHDAQDCGNIPAIESELAADFAACL